MARIPKPHERARTYQLSLRLSDVEKSQLDRAQKQLSAYWGRRAERTEVLRAALELLCKELDENLDKNKSS